eukprot:SAG25_NODE_128_length_14556_cov_11.699405_8_plen_71_part_00
MFLRHMFVSIHRDGRPMVVIVLCLALLLPLWQPPYRLIGSQKIIFCLKRCTLVTEYVARYVLITKARGSY